LHSPLEPNQKGLICFHIFHHLCFFGEKKVRKANRWKKILIVDKKDISIRHKVIKKQSFSQHGLLIVIFLKRIASMSVSNIATQVKEK
jgi:cytidylate kinase